MKRPTYESICEAAKKSKRAAIKSSREKYVYLMSLTPAQLKKISLTFLETDGCAICLRYTRNCPLKPSCPDGYGCISEWQDMKSAWENYCDSPSWKDQYYYEFITYAAKIYLKLLEL